jgi:hypothetical protein
LLPDFGGLIWMFICIIEAVIFIACAMLFVFWVMPPISRRFIRMKWSKGSPAFIQHAGRVYVCSGDAELPEGVTHNKFGWFLKSTNPFRGEHEKRGPGRSPKTSEGETGKQEKVDEALDIVLRTPILDGLDKQVFFGSSDAPLLSNLETLSSLSQEQESKPGSIKHSLLSVIKEVIPATISRSQLEALGTFEYLRGLKVRGGDVIKLVIVAIAVIGVIVTVGLVFWFLTQGKAGGA